MILKVPKVRVLFLQVEELCYACLQHAACSFTENNLPLVPYFAPLIYAVDSNSV